MAYRLVIEVPGAPELPNQIGRKHWSVKAEHARYWRAMVVGHVGHVAPPEPLKKARVRIEVWRKGTADPDNLVASIKPILDGLQPAGTFTRGGRYYARIGANVIADDRPENFEGGRPEVIAHRCKHGEHPHVLVVVEEVA